jgi:hypothetical protein
MKGLTFDEDTHTYRLDGEPVPSVTGVLKAAGLIDFSQIPPWTLDAALRRGRVVHEAIHYYNENDLDVDGFTRDFPDYAGYLQAWIAFTQQRTFRSVLNERRVASRRHQVAGTLDCLGYLDQTPVLLDFATGRPSDVCKDLQTAAYHALAIEWAAEDEDPELATFLANARNVLKRYAVQLRKDGTFTLEPYATPSDFREFLALRDAQRILARRRPVAELVA